MPKLDVIRREIHVDAEVLPDSLTDALKPLGFVEDDFLGGIPYAPRHQLTFEIVGNPIETAQLFKDRWERSTSLAATEKNFKGYIEGEHIPPHYVFNLPLAPYKPRSQFPIPKINLVKCPEDKRKAADIHVKTSHNNTDPTLDEKLLEVGFSYVITPHGNRVYTIQTLDSRDALTALRHLKEYFTQSGGAKQISLEVCSGFYRSMNYVNGRLRLAHAPPVVPFGYFRLLGVS